LAGLYTGYHIRVYRLSFPEPRDYRVVFLYTKNRQAQNSLPELSEKHIIYMLNHFYKHRADEDFYDKIIDGFIHKVYVYDDSLYIIYNLIDTGKDIDKSDIDSLYMSSHINLHGDPPGNRTPNLLIKSSNTRFFYFM
ncbi:hypothetical protein, partial [Pectinatus brassicae]